MTSTTCPHCGHVLDGADSGHAASHHPRSDIQRDYGEPLPPVPDIGTSPSASIDSGDEAPARVNGRAILGAAAIALLTIVGAALFFGANDTDDESPANETADDRSQRSTGESATANNGSTDANAATFEPSGDPNFPPSDEHMAADSIADLFQSIVDDDRRWAAIYPSPLGLQVLSAFGANEPAIEVAVGFEEAARFPLISDGSTSWAINQNNLDTAYLVSTQFVVIDIDREGRVGFVNDSLDPPNIGESSFGAWGPGFDLPAGAKVLPVPGRALFVLPATGGTYEYVTNGVVPYNDDVLVAASENAEIFERCDDQLVCELYAVTPAAPRGAVLDVDVRSKLWISPDGELVIAQAPGAEAEMRWLATGERRTLEGSIRAVDWSDDGSRAAVLSDNELTILMPDNSMASVTLPIEPSGAAVLLVNSDS